MTQIEKKFSKLAEHLIKSKGVCYPRKDFECEDCLYYFITAGGACSFKGAYRFSIEFLEKHKNKQLEFEF